MACDSTSSAWEMAWQSGATSSAWEMAWQSGATSSESVWGLGAEMGTELDLLLQLRTV